MDQKSPFTNLLRAQEEAKLKKIADLEKNKISTEEAVKMLTAIGCDINNPTSPANFTIVRTKVMELTNKNSYDELNKLEEAYKVFLETKTEQKIGQVNEQKDAA